MSFEYVTKAELAPARENLITLIKEAQDILREEFTFRFDFVGSYKRKMVTYDPTSNVGFDFDINIEVNDGNEEYSAAQLKNKIISVLNRVSQKYGYDYAEDSTRVITIKVKDQQHSRILHSCDFAIVNNYTDKHGKKRQEYVHFNKRQKSYTWQEQPSGYYVLPQKENWIKARGHHQKLKDLYLEKKNANRDTNKRSRSLYAEAVHEICQKYGYYDSIQIH